MAAHGGSLPEMAAWIIIFTVLLQTGWTEAQDDIALHMQGSFFSMETGEDVDTKITSRNMESTLFNGELVDRWDDESTTDANGRFDGKLLFYNRDSGCYMCFEIYYRTPNVNQYKKSACYQQQPGDPPPSLDQVCGEILQYTDYYTYFRTTYDIVNCKNTFEGVYNFTYEWNEGGGGICASPESTLVACQEPGSPYVDNQVFVMNFGRCPSVSTSVSEKIRFRCLGTWIEGDNVWSAVEDIGEDVHKEKYRCMLTAYGQEEGDNKIRYTMSWWADCSELKSPYEGPMRLQLQPIVYQSEHTKPECNFPTNYSGHWFHTGEYDVDVDINATHIYFKTKLDEFNYKESYFVCLMNSGSRFLVMAITVGKCEMDYVCLDMLPRHHSIIRWRMGKPYRLTQYEIALYNYKLYMFQQACSYYSFTLDREDIDWNYKTFLLNPPDPIECPIRGRYTFVQSGPSTELIQTRIRGITERPRHMIDCEEYVTEWKSCDNNPTTISLDAEYCETVDHTGRPVGEYDEPDWQLTCVGYWGEDWKSYMITWDPEDPTSAFRCWAYEREDWRFISVSRSTTAFCRPQQTPLSSDPIQGASLSMKLIENERLYDDCAQAYRSGNPWAEQSNYYPDGKSTATITSPASPLLPLLLIITLTASSASSIQML